MINNDNIVEKAVAFSAEAWQGHVSGCFALPELLTAAERVVTISSIEPRDKDLMASAALYSLTQCTDISFETIEKEFGTRIKNILSSAQVLSKDSYMLAESDDSKWREIRQEEINSIKKLPLKLKMLVLSDKLTQLRILQRSYQYYDEGLWSHLVPSDPKLLAWYYYALSAVFYEFEEYACFREFNSIIAQLFVKHK